MIKVSLYLNRLKQIKDFLNMIMKIKKRIDFK